jgi:hypothetical protein
MPTFRTTWTYQGGDGTTWSEVYYQDQSNITDALTPFKALWQSRIAMLAATNTFLGIRCAQVGALRNTGYNVYNNPGVASTATSAADTTGSCAVLSLTGQSGGARKLWIRGLADWEIVHNPASGVPQPPALFLTYVTNFVKQLAANGYGILRITPQAVAPFVNIPILKVDGSLLNGTSVVTMQAAQVFAVPGMALIGGASKKDLPALNGRWTILSQPAPNQLLIRYQTPQGTIVDGGLAHIRQLGFQPTSVVNPSQSGFNYYGVRITKNYVTRSRGSRRGARIRTSL